MISLQPYSFDRFVDRDAEIGLVTGILQQLSNTGEQAALNKTILFRGERGYGKTWLSFHLHRTILKTNNVESLFIALNPLPKEYQNNLADREWAIPGTHQPEAACNLLMQWVCDQLTIRYPKGPNLVEIKKSLVKGVEGKFNQSHFLVLILDSVFEADWNLLEKVENYFLAPLADIPNVLFIMTGRGKPYPWISPALRMGMQEKRMGEFPSKILSKIKSSSAWVSNLKSSELSKLAGGSPLVCYLLLQYKDPIQALDAVADYLLEVVSNGSNPKSLRQAFEALCVLDEFRDGEMEVMLKAYYGAKKEPMPPTTIRELQDELLGTHLFRWEGSGFRVDASLRNVLRNYLKNNQKGLWKHLNCTAYGIYSDFALKYTQYKLDYEKLAEVYRKNLEAIHAWTECQQARQQIPMKSKRRKK